MRFTHSLIYALRLRSRAAVLSPRVTITIGSISGLVAACIPTGFQDTSTGMIAGVIYGLYGATVVAPIVLSLIICQQVAGDDGIEITRDAFLVGAPFLVHRGGALLASLREWASVLLASVGAAAAVGLGDGIRAGTPVGGWSHVGIGSIQALGIQMYVAVLSFGICLALGRRVVAITVSCATPLITVLLIPLAITDWWAWALQLTPYAPIWSAVDPSLAGRFGLEMAWPGRLGVQSAWVMGAAAVVWSSVRHGGLPWLRFEQE